MTGTTIIGVTGGIATGKTHVTDTLHWAGALVLDADVISRRLTGEGGEALPRIRDTFGDSVFRPDGTLDRRALGARVFSSPEERKALEGILHPMILSEMRSRTREAEGIVFWSVPLLYECGMADECALVWCTWVPKAVQVKRVMKRDKLTRREALLRIESQMPARDKAKRADFVIRTDGPKEDTRARVLEAYRELTETKGA
ncbi:MAG: dephospho-CoA kinase [Clostridia bacterium]|nr:dephospho-CoA kinase [Clostridia bacterium]